MAEPAQIFALFFIFVVLPLWGVYRVVKWGKKVIESAAGVDEE